MNPCQIIYEASKSNAKYGNTPGVCRLTGVESIGQLFEKWVKDTFTNHDFLKPGTIISNEAAFCFDEKSELIQQKTGREKVQKFRTYCHIVTENGEWLCLTKADKKRIVKILKAEIPKLVCLTDSGQKHLVFKNKPPMWQLDDSHVSPNSKDFGFLHGVMMELLRMGFSQTEIQTGNYYHSRILKIGVLGWQQIENKIKHRRGEPMFDFAAWLMYTEK